MSLTPRPVPLVPRNPYAKLGLPALIVILIGALSTQDFQPLAIDSSGLVAEMLIALAAAGAIALFLERAVEVLLSIICGAQEATLAARDAMRQTARAEAMKLEQSVLERLPSVEERMAFLEGGGGAQRLASAAMTDPDELEARLHAAVQLKINKQYLSTLMLTVLGGAFAICGFRLLAMVFGETALEGIAPHQVQTLGLLDVVVTTLVLGGGAVGIHQLITRLRTTSSA